MATTGTNATEGIGIDLGSVTTLQWIGVVLAAATGATHVLLWVLDPTSALGVSFLVAGVGFFGGGLGVLANYRRRLLYLVGIPFTAGQIGLWYVVNAPSFSTLGLLDKAVQAAFVVVLVVLYRREP